MIHPNIVDQKLNNSIFYLNNHHNHLEINEDLAPSNDEKIKMHDIKNDLIYKNIFQKFRGNLLVNKSHKLNGINFI